VQTLLITYDLKKPGQNYSALHEAIKECGDWWHYLESTWIVVTPLNVDQASRALRQHIDTNDRLFVVRLRSYDSRDGWLPQEAWDWLNARVVG
jgi:hypothetical protein